MNNRVCLLFLWILPVMGVLTGTTRAHQITLKSGEEVQADTMVLRDGRLTVRSTVDGGTAEVPYPLKLVKKIKFSLTSEEVQWLDGGNTGSLEAVRALWIQRRPFLSLPESDSGKIGLKLARLLVAEQRKTDAEEALKIADRIRKNDWNDSRRQESLAIRVAALAAAGRIDQAMKEADTLQSLVASDDRSLAETQVRARFLEAEVAWSKLLQLETDWPKWTLMPEKRMERMGYLNHSLDGYLFPVIAHPELQAICAEGLVQAATIYLHLKHPDQARIYLDEVIEYFPEPAYVSRARKLRGCLKNAE